MEKLADAVQTFNERKLRFTIQLGDLIDRDMSSFDQILPVYEMIEGKKYHVLGNHDFPEPSDTIVERLGMKNQYYDFKQKIGVSLYLIQMILVFMQIQKDLKSTSRLKKCMIQSRQKVILMHKHGTAELVKNN